MPTIETKDHARIHFEDWGTGKPVVLIHGWPLNAEMWEHQASYLASQGLRVVAYDRRGFGRSSQPWSGYDYDTLASDLAALLEHLSLTGVTLVGFSMGGGEVIRYLTRHGNEGRVRKAVLVSSIIPYMRKQDDNPEGVDPKVFAELKAGIATDRPHALAGFAKQFYNASALSHPVSAEVLAWTQQTALYASPRATLECIGAFSETDFRRELPGIKAPTLVIHGDEDAIVPLAAGGMKAAEMIPAAMLEVYKGAPHGLHLTHAEQLSHDLYEFASR